MRARHYLLLAALLYLVGSFAFGQDLSPERPAFEVASIKQAATREVGGIHVFPSGRISLRGCTLEMLVQQAFHVSQFQISGGPGWLQEDRFDVDAKTPASAAGSRLVSHPRAPLTDEQRSMLRALLVERFRLKFRWETKDRPAYALVRRRGATLKLASPQDKDAFPWAGGLHFGRVGRDGMAATNESMADLAERLSTYFERTVIDRTGLAGSSDFRCDYRAVPSQLEVTEVIHTCLHDVGLRLESTRATVAQLVIDRAERPTAN